MIINLKRIFPVLLILLSLVFPGCNNLNNIAIQEELPWDKEYHEYSFQWDRGPRVFDNDSIIDIDETRYTNREKNSPLNIWNYVLKDVSSSSQLTNEKGQTFHSRALIDQTWRSWVDESEGDSIGENFTINMYIRGRESISSFVPLRIPIAGFALKNGFGHLDHYMANNRVKSFRIYIDGEYSETIEIKDSFSFEQYAFKEPVRAHSIRFVIDDVYFGTINNQTSVAEIALMSHIVSEQEFYENIPLWIVGYYAQYDILFQDYKEITSVSDSDKMSLIGFLPFNLPSLNNRQHNYSRFRIPETGIAHLDGQSSLRLQENLPRLDGATAMYPLYSAFAGAVYPEKEPDELLINWGYFPNLNLLQDLIRYSDYYETGIITNEYIASNFFSIVQCNTTPLAYQRLIDGETDIIFCYAPSEEQIRAAAEKGLQFNLTPIAKDAFVFIVNEKNVLNNITQRQIRDIYSGRVTNWQSISKVNEPIIPYQRPADSGSQTALLSIMGDDQLMPPLLENESVIKGMGQIISVVASDYYNYNAAIGYTFKFFLNSMTDNSGIKTLSIDGIAPTPQNIRSGRYPFTQTVYAITIGNESENTKKFIEWILSSQGQELVEKTGYTSVR